MTRVKSFNKKDAVKSLLTYRLGKSDKALAEKLVNNSSIISLKKKETLYLQGDILEQTYHLISGLIKMYRHNEDGREIVFKYIFPDESFAKSIISGKTLLSSEALENCEILAVDKKILKDAAFRDNAVLEDMLNSCKNEFEFYVTYIEELMLTDTRQRLEKYLVQHAVKMQSDNFILPVPRCELATLLGTTPENLSRIIRTMAEQGEIRFRGRHVSISYDWKNSIKT